ncbi:hypothetical protein ACSNOJ_01110 [Streptomyces sp. URMC 128]|uniref:hypothetical protein n=1 Tax=Streptomyces sp. URMC 128 TaxID=3423404 RepID=UPI003F1AB699
MSTERHPSGLWRTRLNGTVVRTGFDPEQAEERALMAALALEQLGKVDDAEVAPAWLGTIPAVDRAGEITSALGLTWHDAVLPSLVAADLAGIVLGTGSAA